jgi:hypothetical protein
VTGEGWRKEGFMSAKATQCAIILCLIPGASMSQTRMPAIPEDQYTEAQHKAAQEFLATRQTPVFGPFIPLIRSPELMLRVKEMGDLQTFWAESALSAIEGEAELHLKTEAYPESRQDTQSSDLSSPFKVATRRPNALATAGESVTAMLASVCYWSSIPSPD